jgi:hypothetical protein
MEKEDGSRRPWGIGLFLLALGLVVSAVANGPGLYGDPGPLLRAVGSAGFIAGLLLAGMGIHRILWARPSQRSRVVRVLITALVTFPAFIGVGLLLAFLFSFNQLRNI